MRTFTKENSSITQERLETILDGVGDLRIGIVGDFCLDAYWHADMTRSVLSRETPHFPLPVYSETYSPGGAGNVAANVAALMPQALYLMGTRGKDWRGDLLRGLLSKLGAEVHLLECAGRVTPAYIKPMLHGMGDSLQEQARVDFENDLPLDEESERALIREINMVASSLDVLLVCDQMRNGCVTEKVRNEICRLGEEGLCVIADSRENIGAFHHVIVKPNEIEAAGSMDETIPLDEICLALARKNNQKAIVTLGSLGCYVSDGRDVSHVLAFPAEPPFDICGAGDTFMSALACCLRNCQDLEEAAFIANMASSVTIRKIGMTGTASREELLSLC